MSSEIRATLRRLKPEKQLRVLRPRPESQLMFFDAVGRRPNKLLYDTTVYIDILKDRFPQNAETLLRSSEAWHSPVTEAELAASCGLLDPGHPQTRRIRDQIIAVIEQRPTYRTLTTDSEIWREGGVLSGTLARLQGYEREQRRRVLNDALLFVTARKHGCAVLTRNVRDFDYLQQLDPSGRVLFYQ